MVGLGRFELPTHGLGNRGATVHPVRNNAFSVGSDASHSGPSVQFGHKYAPHKFSEQRSFDVDVFVTVRSASSQHWVRIYLTPGEESREDESSGGAR